MAAARYPAGPAQILVGQGHRHPTRGLGDEAVHQRLAVGGVGKGCGLHGLADAPHCDHSGDGAVQRPLGICNRFGSGDTMEAIHQEQPAVHIIDLDRRELGPGLHAAGVLLDRLGIDLGADLEGFMVPDDVRDVQLLHVGAGRHCYPLCCWKN